MRKKNVFLFSLMVIIFALIVFSFINEIEWFFAQKFGFTIIQGNWELALIHIIVFSSFLIFIPIHYNNLDWKSKSIYVAFFIALFFEMFGFPLTVYFVSSFVGLSSANIQPTVLFKFGLFGLTIDVDYNYFMATLLSALGLTAIILGWRKVYHSQGKLVETGIYSIVRHPQYFAIIFITFVWMLAWPSLLTMIMWPILAWLYYNLAIKEENLMGRKFGKKFDEYKNKVPMFIPFSKF